MQIPINKTLFKNKYLVLFTHADLIYRISKCGIIFCLIVSFFSFLLFLNKGKMTYFSQILTSAFSGLETPKSFTQVYLYFYFFWKTHFFISFTVIYLFCSVNPNGFFPQLLVQTWNVLVQILLRFNWMNRHKATFRATIISQLLGLYNVRKRWNQWGQRYCRRSL